MLVEDLIVNAYGQAQLNSMLRGHNPKGVVIHNTADDMSADARISMLKNHNLEAGFAHYYVDGGKVQQVMGEQYIAWHTANQTGNYEYIGIEVGNSTGNEDQFLANEQLAFTLAKQILTKYGLPVDRNTVKLHKQFVATACPHRSTELHGVDPLVVQDYFISQVNGQAGTVTPQKPTTPDTPQNDVDFMRQYGFVIWNSKSFHVDDRGFVNGMWQVISNELGGLQPSATTSSEEWRNNGVPMSGVSWTDGTSNDLTTGGSFRFNQDRMDIVDYDVPSNGIAVMVSGEKIWVDATVAKNA